MSKFKYIVNIAKFQDLRPLIYKKGFKINECHTDYTSFTITEFKNNSDVIKVEVDEQNDVVTIGSSIDLSNLSEGGSE
jgi:hypothetical protein